MVVVGAAAADDDAAEADDDHVLSSLMALSLLIRELHDFNSCHRKTRATTLTFHIVLCLVRNHDFQSRHPKNPEPP